MRYYVSMTWHGWPEGGSYATEVEAESASDAEEQCRAEMAEAVCYDRGVHFDVGDDAEAYFNERAQVVEEFWDRWHVVDCFDIDEFVAEHSGPSHGTLPVEGGAS